MLRLTEKKSISTEMRQLYVQQYNNENNTLRLTSFTSTSLQMCLLQRSSNKDNHTAAHLLQLSKHKDVSTIRQHTVVNLIKLHKRNDTSATIRNAINYVLLHKCKNAPTVCGSI